MENFTRMLNARLILLIYMVVGVYCMKVHIINQETKKKLVDLILKTTLPCMIFNSFNKPLTPEVLIQTTLILVVTFRISILFFFLGKAVYSRYLLEKKSIFQYCTLVSNSGFLGMPVVASVYENDGLLTASIFIIPNRIFMWTAGLLVFTTADLRTKCRNILLNPYIITVLLGLARQVSGFPVPGFLDTAIANIGVVTSPLSMMVIGTMLIGAPWEKLLESSLFYLAFVRLIALPLVALVILSLIRVKPVLAGVSLILTGMSVGSTSAFLAAKYRADEDYASKRIVTTTLPFLVTVPLLMLLL